MQMCIRDRYLTGDMYLKGLGGEIDYDKALKLFHQSAAGGNTYAENNIGFMYTYGLGVTKDYSQAFKWLNLSLIHIFLTLCTSSPYSTPNTHSTRRISCLL